MTKTKKTLFTTLLGVSACVCGVAASAQPTHTAKAESAISAYTQSFVMDNGAKILCDGENTGIRFTAMLDSEAYTSLIGLNSETVEVAFGMIVMPYDYVTADKQLTKENLFGANNAAAQYCFKDATECDCSLTHVSRYESEKLYENEKYPGKRLISCSLIDIMPNNIARPFVGIGYISHTDKTNPDAPVVEYELAPFYQNDIMNNVRSPLYTAQVTHELDPIGDGGRKFIEDEYFASYVGKNFKYTVNYNVVNKKDNSVIKTETVTKSAAFNTKISAPDYDGADADFAKLTKVQDDTQYTVYTENKTVINVNYVNDVAPTITGELPEVLFENEIQAFDFAATDALGAAATVVKTVTDKDGNTIDVDTEYAFDTVGEYTLKVTATDVHGNVAEKSSQFVVIGAEQYGGKMSVSAFDSVDDIVGRAGSGWTVTNFSFDDNGGATAAYLQTTTEFEEELAGKMPTVKYSRKEGQTGYMTVRVGLQPTLTKTDLIGYKKYSGVDTLYVEFYNEHTQWPAAIKVMLKLVGVNEDGTGVYEKFEVKSGQWNTIAFDIDMLIDNYDTIFYPQAHHSTKPAGKGLVLLSAGGMTTEGSSADMVSEKNFYYFGGIFFSSEENLAMEKYVGVEKLNAISSVGGTIFEGDIVARGYVGNSELVYNNFADDGGCSAAWIQITTDFTEQVAGKMPTVKYSTLENKYLAARYGIQTVISKADLINYKQYSGLTKLCFEFYNEHEQWPAAIKKIKKLVGVNEDGTGVYEMVDIKSGEWNTFEFDIDMLIEHYDTIFYPTAKHGTKPVAGLCLLVSANTAEGSSADMVNHLNHCYIGEIYFAK